MRKLARQTRCAGQGIFATGFTSTPSTLIPIPLKTRNLKPSKKQPDSLPFGDIYLDNFRGGGSTLSRAVVQSAGHGYRLKVSAMQAEFEHGGPVLHLLLRYTQALITETAQTAVCNRHHTFDQQLCRWLLLSLDRIRGPELVMTQELIANMLGVRREGVTGAAGAALKL